MDTATTFEKINLRPFRGGDEYVVFRAANRYAGSKLANHPGGVAKTKTRHNRRTRRTANQALRTYA
jgi:hypothetical protein